MSQNATPKAIIAIDQKIRTFAPYLLMAYPLASDVNALGKRNP